jgi:hypothetical protein
MRLCRNGWKNASSKIAAGLSDEGEKVFIQLSAQDDLHRMRLLESFGYKAVRWYFSMWRD